MSFRPEPGVGDTAVWVGTYPEPNGGAEGIWRVDIDAGAGVFLGSELVAVTPSPSYLAVHPEGHSLYAVAELEAGAVTAYAVEQGQLRPFAPAVGTGGSHPCHLAVIGTEVWVANYGDGTVSALPLGADGAVRGEPRVFAHHGEGPDRERQSSPHAHFVADVGGSPVVVDLGTDELWHHSTSSRGTSAVIGSLPRGTGPRHAVVLPDGVLAVVGELDPVLHLLIPTDDGYDLVARFELGDATPVDGDRNFPSHIALSSDRLRLFIAVRGANVIVTFALRWPLGPVPELEYLGDTPVGGRWPRHFAVLTPPDGETPEADTLIVAAQGSSLLTLVRIPRDGDRGVVVDAYDVPAPACVLEV